jgi:hypothetical protein
LLIKVRIFRFKTISIIIKKDRFQRSWTWFVPRSWNCRFPAHVSRIQSRVTRWLSEFSPIGWLFTLGSLKKQNIFRNSPHYWATFSIVKAVHQFRLKCIGLCFGRFFSQTHRVTLIQSARRKKFKSDICQNLNCNWRLVTDNH